eukprot:6421422-Amphidinium_carterae.1
MATKHDLDLLHYAYKQILACRLTKDSDNPHKNDDKNNALNHLCNTILCICSQTQSGACLKCSLQGSSTPSLFLILKPIPILDLALPVWARSTCGPSRLAA